jgi:hypothetical protein
MYNAYITTLTNVRKHANADRMLLADCFGNTVCVGLDAKDGDVVIYFPTDGQLSVEYCAQNDLVRRKDENGNPAGGYLDPEKRNIRAIRLRGERSDGLTMPLSSLAYTGVDITTLTIGPLPSVVNGHEICQKYIPKTNAKSYMGGAVNKTRKKKVPVAPLFAEHADTEQLAYNLSAFKPGDEIEITLKMHGTSQRTGYVPTFTGYKKDFWGRVLACVNPDKHLGKYAQKLYNKAADLATPLYDWGHVSGTRRVVLDTFEGGFYGSNEFREKHSKAFEGKLMKGETVYYEVVGYTHTGTSIMPTVNNHKLQDKEFIKMYGDETTFTYGCGIYQSDIYVYRMTMTNEDGFVIEYTPEFMRYRCEQMGIKTVPVLWRGKIPEHPGSKDDPTITAGEWIKNVAELYYDGPDPVGKKHVREGVVVRILNRPKFAAYKHKNFSFKVLEGIAKVEADAPDMEEAQDVSENT